MIERLTAYGQLIRLDKPIGTFLLLWPTLWAIWLASHGQPQAKILMIFLLGTFVMRAAGCAMNDIADRKFDAHVARTKTRPLASGSISLIEAIILCLGLLGIAFSLTIALNLYTIVLALIGAMIAALYPLMKRITHWPQLGIGAAFSWGIPMAFAAQTNHIPASAWLLFFTAMLWTLIYDTFYAMSDREDDLQIGLKSTAILFGQNDRLFLFILQGCLMVLLTIIGMIFQLDNRYYACLLITSAFGLYQQWLIRNREPKKCHQAFLNNNWSGFFIFLGVFLSYLP